MALPKRSGAAGGRGADCSMHSGGSHERREHLRVFAIPIGKENESSYSRSGVAIPACPREAANTRAVSPLRSGMSGLISSRSNSNFTTPSCPPFAASQSGVWLSKVSGILGSVSLRSNSSFTTPSCPSCAAHQSGV